MRLLDDIIDSIPRKPAQDIRVGLKYTAVEIDKRVGLAHTFPEHKSPAQVGELTGKDVVELAYSWNLIEASIGVAAINALIKPKNYREIEIFDRILSIIEDYKKIGIVGYFKPLIEKLPKEKQIFIFEREPWYGVLPESAEEDLIPKCDLVIISGSALVNKTLEQLLKIAQGYTLVTGPTTPLTTILFEYGADALAGSLVTDPKKALEIVSQGGGRKELSGVIKFVYLEKK